MPNDKEFELDDLESFSFDDLSLDEAPPSSDSAPGEDPFGVWVKSAPEDVEPLAELPEETPLEPTSDSLPEEDFLSMEELANLDDSFDIVTVEEPLAGEEPLDDEVAFLDSPAAKQAESAAPSFDEVSLDDFVSFDDADLEEAPAGGAATLKAPDLAAELDDGNEEFLDIDIDIDDDINDEELEIIEGALPRTPDELEEVSLDGFTAQEVDLSEFGDFEEVTPVAAAGPLDQGEDLPEVVDLPELDALDELPEIETAAAQSPEEDFFEEQVLADDLPSLIDEGPVDLDLEPHEEPDMAQILALEEHLTSGIREPEAVANQGGGDLAAQLLGKIERELSSIKQEITELKREMTSFRAPSSSPAPAAEMPDPLPVKDAEKSKGFFDEEDDETIALTGDELDNILSTAEISEGEESGVTLDEDLLSVDPEGNLIEPEEMHVTDEEFFAGTALDDNEPALPGSDDLGIPQSIELEESLPLDLEEGTTEDLLGDAGDEFEVEPLPEGLLEGPPEALEIPFDDEIGLDLDDEGPLGSELLEEAVPETSVLEPELSHADSPSLDDLPPLEDLEDVSLSSSADNDGWTPPPAEDLSPLESAVAPPPPTPLPAGGSMTPGLKDELRAVLTYMDKLLASLPDDKIQEFAESEHFEVYKRLFEELGLIE